jgi:hypothetical protein
LRKLRRSISDLVELFLFIAFPFLGAKQESVSIGNSPLTSTLTAQ